MLDSVFIFKPPYLIPWRRGDVGRGAPHINLYGEVLPKKGTFLFVYFWYGEVKKNISAVGTIGKNALKWVTLPSFESDLLKTDEDIGPQSREILQTFVWWRPAQTCFPPTLPHHVQRSVVFHKFPELYLCTFKTYRFQMWQCYSHWN